MPRWILASILLLGPSLGRAQTFCQPSLLDVPVGVEIAFVRNRLGVLEEIDFTDLTTEKSAQAIFSENELSFSMRLAWGDRKHPRQLYGRDIVRLALVLAERPVHTLVGNWLYGDNLRRYNELTKKGYSGVEAAAETWTGRVAARFGFTEIEYVRQDGEPGAHRLVCYKFTRPQGSIESNSSGNIMGEVTSPSSR